MKRALGKFLCWLGIHKRPSTGNRFYSCGRVGCGAIVLERWK